MRASHSRTPTPTHNTHTSRFMRTHFPSGQEHSGAVHVDRGQVTYTHTHTHTRTRTHTPSLVKGILTCAQVGKSTLVQCMLNEGKSATRAWSGFLSKSKSERNVATDGIDINEVTFGE